MVPDRDLPLSPTPPTHVRVAYATGLVVPCDLVYDGLDDDGIHRWLAAAPVPLEDLLAGLATVRIETLPARTAVEFTSTC